jgi:hypothetical protein
MTLEQVGHGPVLVLDPQNAHLAFGVWSAWAGVHCITDGSRQGSVRVEGVLLWDAFAEVASRAIFPLVRGRELISWITVRQ